MVARGALHAIDPQQYLDEVLRVLPYWPKERYLELAPKLWATTCAKLRADELAAPMGASAFLLELERRATPARLASMGDPIDFVVTLGTDRSRGWGRVERQTERGRFITRDRRPLLPDASPMKRHFAHGVAREREGAGR